jgi:outer membrane cobalamin receptor
MVATRHRASCTRSWLGWAVALCVALWASPSLSQEKSDEEKKKEDEGTVLKVTEDEIVFKDESGEVVKIADFDQLPLEQLLQEEVVRTGSKREQASSVSLSTVSVITKDEIELSPDFYVGDMLAYVPGLDVRWGKMQRLYVGTRGLGGTALNSRMLLLWDGLPLNDPFTGELSLGHFVPMVDVERIEVIRGPGSTMYGANAYSGVVNVITSQEAKGVRASALFGSNFTSRLQAAYAQPVGPVKLSTSVEAFRTDGPFPSVSRFLENEMEWVKNDDVKNVNVGFNAAYKGIRLSARYTWGERGRPGTFTTDRRTGNIVPCQTCHIEQAPYGKGAQYPATDQSCGTCHMAPRDRETTHRGNVSLSFERALGKGFMVSALAYHNEYRTSYKIYKSPGFLERPVEEGLEIAQRSTGADAYVSHAYKKINTLVVGLSGRRYEVASDLLITEGGNHNAEAEVAVYAEDEIRPLKWLSITGGARLDYNSRFGVAVSPRGGIVLSPFERFALRGSIGRAFRNPSPSELYVAEKRGKYLVQGNPDLSSEWITSIEGGVTYAIPIREAVLRVSGLYFWDRATDLVSFRATSVDEARFFNLGSVTGQGTEVEATLELAKPKLKVFASYSYQRVRDDETGVALPYAPESKASGGFYGKVGPVGGLLRARLVGERSDDLGIKLPMFATLDASVQVNVWKGLTLALWMKNLSGSEYQESLGIPAAGRSFFLSVGYLPQ